MNNHNHKKELFNELRNYYFLTKEIKLSVLRNTSIIDEIKSLKVIELDNLENFESYKHYDNYLIFKCNENYYFCDTELISGLKEDSLIRIADFNQHLRKEKIKKIDENSTD